MERVNPLILIADDQKPTLTILERIFLREGYDVISVENGFDAVQKSQEEHPDLVLLDVNMPILNGFEALKQLRESPSTSDIPVILVTALEDADSVTKGLNLGADDYIKKPFHPQELLARVISKIKASRLERALQAKRQTTEVLLRVSDRLNRFLQIDDDLIRFIIYIIHDLMPSEMIFNYFLSDKQEILMQHAFTIQTHEITSNMPNWNLEGFIHHDDYVISWENDVSIIPPYPCGMIIKLMFRGVTRGILGVVNYTAYNDDLLQLFIGLAHQITLSLENAELYQVKANYAEELEHEVIKRTEELASTQKMLIHSEKLASIGRLVAAIAHEINNPLLPIKLDLEGVMEDIELGHQVELSDIQHIFENINRIENTIKNLLGFTGNKEFDSGNQTLVDINLVISSVIDINRKLLHQQNIIIDENFIDVPFIYGNRYQLEYIFMNLIINAKDAMPNGGTLSFKTYVSPDQKQVFTLISDTGIGISADIKDTIFEPFFSSKENGNGLGLYISYDIIQRHHGTITVTTKEGHGTQFLIVFDAAPQSNQGQSMFP